MTIVKFRYLGPPARRAAFNFVESSFRQPSLLL